MSNPSGDYNFAGLGFNGLRFGQDGGQYSGYLYYGEGSSTPISGATYTDTTGVVTFGAGKSPAGVSDLNFTGNIILDLNGDVTAIAGTWTGRSIINAPVEAATAVAPTADPVTQKIGNIPILQAHGAWSAFNRQNTIV
jgi:hypothetical protein